MIVQESAAAPSVEAGPSSSQHRDEAAEKTHKPRETNKSHVKDMLGAMAALQQQDRYLTTAVHDCFQKRPSCVLFHGKDQGSHHYRQCLCNQT